MTNNTNEDGEDRNNRAEATRTRSNGGRLIGAIETEASQKGASVPAFLEKLQTASTRACAAGLAGYSIPQSEGGPEVSARYGFLACL